MLEGEDNAVSEIRELFIDSGASANANFSVEFNGITSVIALNTTDHTTAKNVAWEIVNASGTQWDPADNSREWNAEIVGPSGNHIRFTHLTKTTLNGNFSVNPSTTGVTVNSFVQRTAIAPIQNNWVFQENWNIDRCDGTGPSGFVLNPQKGNVYQIRYAYLGFGPVKYFIKDNMTGKFILVHMIKYPNTSEETSIEAPHMPIQASITSILTINNLTQPLDLSIGSWGYFTEGPIEHIIPKFSVFQNLTQDISTTTERILLMIKHPDIYNEGPSLIGVFLKQISVSYETNNAGNGYIAVRINPTYTTDKGTPLWKYVEYPNTPILYATSVNQEIGISEPSGVTASNLLAYRSSITGGTVISSQGTAADGVTLFNDLEGYELNRGDVLSVSIFARNSTTPTATVSWVEDH